MGKRAEKTGSDLLTEALMNKNIWRCTSVSIGLLAATLSALAGRPLSVEDAGVNELAQCQVESWFSRTSGAGTSLVVAPACGVMPGVELGLEVDAPRHTSTTDAGRGLALKWVPEWAQYGDWKLGAKLSVGSDMPAGSGQWQSAPTSVLGIATYSLNEQWTAHVNVGLDVEHHPRDRKANAGLALVWTPHERWLVFAELTGTEQQSATRGAGARYWLIPEVLGLDATLSKANAVKDSTNWTLGLGWYGIKF
jgi:hypothetical protein